MSPPSNPHEFWLFPTAFVGVWMATGFVISLMGWHWFAIRYPVKTRPPGTAYASPSTRFRFPLAGYSNVVRVIFTEEGIYFHVLFLFRPFHPPFLVPWESVARVEKTRRFFWPCYRIDIEDTAGKICVTLPAAIENDLLQFKKKQPVDTLV